MAYSYAVPGSLTNTRQDVMTQPEEQYRNAQAFSNQPFVNTTTQSFSAAESELLEDSVPGGLEDEFSGVTTRERIQPTMNAPSSMQTEEQKQLAALGGLQRHPAFKATQLQDILTAPHVNYWDQDDNRFDDFYKHDTYGSPYINSHRLQLEDFHPGMMTEQFSGAFTGVDRPEVTGDAVKQYQSLVAGTDDRDKAVKLFVQRFGTPENLNELVKTGHLHQSDLTALQNMNNGSVPQNEPMMQRTMTQRMNNVLEGAGRTGVNALPGDYDWEPLNKKKLASSNDQSMMRTSSGRGGGSQQSLIQEAISDFAKWGGDTSHLSSREIEELKRIGIVQDLATGHEKALVRESHPRFGQRTVFKPNSAYHNWDGGGAVEIPRYPTYSYQEFNSFGNRGE
jgi:hypothetical protein